MNELIYCEFKHDRKIFWLKLFLSMQRFLFLIGMSLDDVGRSLADVFQNGLSDAVRGDVSESSDECSQFTSLEEHTKREKTFLS